MADASQAAINWLEVVERTTAASLTKLISKLQQRINHQNDADNFIPRNTHRLAGHLACIAYQLNNARMGQTSRECCEAGRREVDARMDEVVGMMFASSDLGIIYRELISVENKAVELMALDTFHEEEVSPLLNTLDTVADSLERCIETVATFSSSSSMLPRQPRRRANNPPPDLAIVRAKLHECYRKVWMLVYEKSGQIHPQLLVDHNELIEIRRFLDEMKLEPSRIKLKELNQTQSRLDAINAKRRRDGSFVDENNVPLRGQHVVVELLDNNMRNLVELGAPFDVIGPSRTLCTQLLDMRARLEQAYAAPTPPDLYTVHGWQQELDKIDAQRRDPLFIILIDDGGRLVPEGLGIMYALTLQCYRLIFLLLALAEEDEESLWRAVDKVAVAEKQKAAEEEMTTVPGNRRKSMYVA
ncbi:uncharacterized protein VTP21DRAFT_31 [Calcarisporiella thermophila]|uniref:uncharacterized protein n=1 Tax=Calcarisporiella thermophila TaxID=911321 RepID=UPI003742845E